MLVLSRKRGEGIVIGDDVRVTVLEVSGSRVKLGFSGPPEVSFQREEIYVELEDEPPCSTPRMPCPQCVCV